MQIDFLHNRSIYVKEEINQLINHLKVVNFYLISDDEIILWLYFIHVGFTFIWFIFESKQEKNRERSFC